MRVGKYLNQDGMAGLLIIFRSNTKNKTKILIDTSEINLNQQFENILCTDGS